MSRIRRLTRSTAARLRPHVASLTGQPALVERLDACLAAVEEHARKIEAQQALLELQGVKVLDLQAQLVALEVNICERLDVMGRTVQDIAVDETTPRMLADEIDRLDGYLLYHADAIRKSLDDVATVVGADANRLGEPLPVAPPMISAGPGLDVIVCSVDADFVVPTREEGLLTYFARHGTEATEPGVRAVLMGLLRPGDVAVDAGANVGVLAVPMAAAVGPTGRVVCFEPLPHLVDALERTMRLNGFADRSEVQAVALADSSGTADFFMARHSPLSSLFRIADGAAAEPHQVQLTTLDDVVPPGGRVDVVKIDVEGAEARVWRGMKRVRDDNARLAVVMEWSASHFSRAGEEPVAFMREIVADGFSVALIEDDPPGALTPVAMEQADELEARNVLLLRGH
jgi:FkbM family methyltransferase